MSPAQMHLSKYFRKGSLKERLKRKLHTELGVLNFSQSPNLPSDCRLLFRELKIISHKKNQTVPLPGQGHICDLTCSSKPSSHTFPSVPQTKHGPRKAPHNAPLPALPKILPCRSIPALLASTSPLLQHF